MQERLRYVNHLNEVIDFGRSGIYVSRNELHDYDWATQTKNDRISSFRKTVTKRALPVVIFCASPEEGVTARNRLMEIAEKDVLAKKPGHLVIGDYYYKCYITESKKSSYLRSRQLMEVKLTITSDYPYWIKETTQSFRKSKAGVGEPFDFFYDYPTDYTQPFQQSALVNADFTASNFKLIIYGPASQPTVYISDHAYSMACDIEAGEYILIDSAAKTVTKTALDGTQTNLFHLRGREAYIFEKIKSGSNTISWSGDFGVDVILLEERSEPKWT